MDEPITDYTAEDSVSAFFEKYVDIGKFLGYCRACPNYGKKWSCPPYAADAAGVWSAYTRVRLFLRRIDLPELAGQTGETAEGRVKEIRAAAQRDLAEKLYALERAYPGSRALLAGSCGLCAVCARPEGQPCRHPERMRPSVEAMGGDVVRLAEDYFSVRLQWTEGGAVPAYTVLAAALLLP